MKTKKIFTLVLIVLSILFTLTNCNKEEVSNTGTLKISFYNKSNFGYDISSIENTDISICSIKTDENGNAEKELNIGNYVIHIHNNTYVYSLGFQIKPNKTTKIIWKDGSSPEVE